MAVKHITEGEFEAEVLKSDVPVLVDFFANWCGPCKMMAPILDQLSDEMDNIKFVGLDVDDAERTAIEYGISNIPCFIYFKNGEEATRHMGRISKGDLKALLS